MEESVWARLYESATAPPLHPALAGFNVNLDRIISVNKEMIESPVLRSTGFLEFRSHLTHSMERCTAEEWYVPDMDQYSRYTGFFSRIGSLSMGGQAGIAALHLASLCIPKVICVAPAMGTLTRRMLEKEGVYVPGNDDGDAICPDSVHLVFEYQPGIVPLTEGALARDNRFIVSPQKKGENTILPKKTFDRILPAISSCSRAFLSGYQYLIGEEEFIRAAGQIRAFKENNPDLRVHIECVSVTDAGVLLGIVQHILPAADSAGMNESELVHLVNAVSEDPRRQEETEKLSPTRLVQDLLELAAKTGLARIHLHTFGYYILVMEKDRGVPEDSRAALLYAAKVVVSAAGGAGSRISPAGIDAIDQVEKVFGTQQSPGIFLHGDYSILVIPTIIAQSIQKTVGLGDIISSTALVADRF